MRDCFSILVERDPANGAHAVVQVQAVRGSERSTMMLNVTRAEADLLEARGVRTVGEVIAGSLGHIELQAWARRTLGVRA